MKALQINNYGNTDVLEIVDIKKPKANEGQVLIENYASSINPVDKIFSFDKIKEVFKEEGGVRGKIVIEIKK